MFQVKNNVHFLILENGFNINLGGLSGGLSGSLSGG